MREERDDAFIASEAFVPTMAFDRNTPYDDLPPLPPHADLETPEVLKACIRASRSLAELKGLMGSIPDQRILLELLPLRESEASSAIENIRSSKERLFLATSGEEEETDRFTREILGYNKALVKAKGGIPDLETIRGICSTLLDGEARFRSGDDDEVYLVAPGMAGSVYTPPGGSRVAEKLRNLQEYIFTDGETDPLVKMAVIHYQFEAIHPFFDGNGRTGRILNVLFLQYDGLLDDPLLFLSDYIIRNKTRYYELLAGVTEEREWIPWILFILDAVDVTSRETIALIHRIASSISGCRRRCSDLGIPEKCAEIVASNPFCTIGRMADGLGCSRPTASKYMHALAETGILEESRSGKYTVFRNVGLLELFLRFDM